MKDQIILCRDILDRIRRIGQYASVGRDEFLSSELHQDAVIRSFEVIGEIVKRLDPDLIVKYQQVAWGDFAGFRDVLIHQYHHIRLDLVWDFLQEDLPSLRSTIELIIEDLDTGNASEV
ncbi:MAG: DUF86 domain-containing protein [Chloroflexi bacterium]|nr:DUF86 domain-containing protein [Chloroflexota bacterium]